MALQCADKKGLVIQGNGQRYEFKQGDNIPERIFENDFIADQGIDFCKALIENGRIKEVADEKKSKKEKKEEGVK